MDGTRLTLTYYISFLCHSKLFLYGLCIHLCIYLCMNISTYENIYVFIYPKDYNVPSMYLYIYMYYGNGLMSLNPKISVI